MEAVSFNWGSARDFIGAMSEFSWNHEQVFIGAVNFHGAVGEFS